MCVCVRVRRNIIYMLFNFFSLSKPIMSIFHVIKYSKAVIIVAKYSTVLTWLFFHCFTIIGDQDFFSLFYNYKWDCSKYYEPIYDHFLRIFKIIFILLPLHLTISPFIFIIQNWKIVIELKFVFYLWSLECHNKI